MKTQKIALMLMVAILICGCSSAEEDQEKEQIKDQDTSILTSCSSDAVTNVSISTVSWDDTSQICDKMARTIGANPSVRSLRALSKSVYAMYLKGNTTALADNAYQFMRVVESRGQLHDDAAMINTFDVLFKVFNGTDGRVTPKDLNIMLSNYGSASKNLSDDGIYTFGSTISVEKQNAGE